jgi:hypothetical protein
VERGGFGSRLLRWKGSAAAPPADRQERRHRAWVIWKEQIDREKIIL